MVAAAKWTAALLMMVNVTVIAADPIPNSDCLDTGSWECIRQARRLCNWGPGTCTEHDCVGCNDGPDTLPAKMCFMSEQTNPCYPGSTEVICSIHYGTAECVVEEGTEDCICEVTAPPSGTCKFTSCDD
jgi:hypothetical protein